MKCIGKAQKNLVSENQTLDIRTPARTALLGDRQQRRHDVARVPVKRTRIMIGIGHFRIARSRGIHKRRDIGQRFHACAYDGRAIRLRQTGGKIARHTSRFAKKRAYQAAQRVDHAHLGGMYGLRRQHVKPKLRCIFG